MSRSIHRVFAALLSLWFAVLTVEPARLHSCPMHDGHAAVGASASRPAGHADHAGHGQPANGAPKPSHSCTCIGTCATVAVPVEPLPTTFEFADVAGESDGLPAYTRPVAAVAYSIPFANGPPRA